MLNLNGLCSIVWTNYGLDLIVLGILIFVTWFCGKKGFIVCFFSLISVISALLVAILFTKLVVTVTGGLFGLQETLSKSFETAFLKIDGFSIDISNAGLTAALTEKNLPSFLVDLIIDNYGNESIAAGTTLAMATSNTLSGVCINLITWIGLVGITWGLMWLLKKILKNIAKQIKLINRIDILLGCFVGLFLSFLGIYVVLGILSLIPSEAITSYLNNSLFVGSLYNNNLLTKLLGMMIS